MSLNLLIYLKYMGKNICIYIYIAKRGAASKKSRTLVAGGLREYIVLEEVQ